MAQAKVSDFFGRKKRSQEINPSKRRKLESADLESKSALAVESTLSSGKSIDGTLVHSGTKTSAPETKLKRKPTAKPTPRARGSAKKKHALKGQVSIHDAFSKASGSSGDTDGQSDPLSEPTEIPEEVTSFWDEHDGPKTPKRKVRPSDSLEAPLSDSLENQSSVRRRKKATRRSPGDDQETPKKPEQIEEEKAVRGRNLAQIFQRNIAAELQDSGSVDQKESEKGSAVVSVLSPSKTTVKQQQHASKKIQPAATEEEPVSLPSVEDMAKLMKLSHPVPISPLPPTPQGLKHGPKKTVASSSKIRSSAEKLKELQKNDDDDDSSQKKESDQTEASSKSATRGNSSKSKKVISAEEMRERLSKCGKLDTLKAKLAEMNSSLKAVRKREAEKKAESVLEEEVAEVEPVAVGKTPAATKAEASSSAEKKPAPAYERYEHLAREGPPTLALPGKYQRLLNMFQGTDTVVSMLFNRQETITFSKLKNAVQSMTKKNFEEKTLGQIKTVYSDAYSFRQEKGLPLFGNKVSGYQLTVEPSFQGLDKEEVRTDKKEKLTMSPQVLLKRKRIFHNSLIDITKDHHATFLSKLKPPIEVPPALLTRWHPRFGLDTVADIEPAQLPAPPVQKAQSAKQVLEIVQGKLPARVEQAMARVAMSSEAKASTSKEQPKSAVKPPTTTTAPAKPANAALKGIPLSLLEKIRAKEAAKTQAALMRDPKEDRKTEMIGRLPILIRSLRTFYVTEKKPSLPYRTVVEKLADSYDTSISTADVEAHLVLLQELAPKWIQVIEITRGKFVKIDKNMDISTIITHLTNLAKSRR